MVVSEIKQNRLIINSDRSYNIIFVLTFIAIFILNNDRTNSNVIILNVILSFFTILYGLLLYFKPQLARSPSKLEILLFFFLAVSCIFVFFVRSYLVLHIIYIAVAFYIAYSKKTLPKSYCKVAIIIGTISIIIQLFLFRSPDGRHVLSYIDPNYSGYCIFSLILFSWYNQQYKISFLLSIIGCILLSRAFFIAIFVFYLFVALRRISYKFQKIPYSIYLFSAYIGLFILSVLFIAKFEGTEIINQKGSKDITEFADQSNMDRFMANTLFVSQLIQFPDEYIAGKDLSIYKRTVFINSPHNSIGQLILNYGFVFSFFYITLFCYLLEYYRSRSFTFFPAFCSMLIYTLFLGGVIFGVQVIWWSFIFKSSMRNNI